MLSLVKPVFPFYVRMVSQKGQDTYNSFCIRGWEFHFVLDGHGVGTALTEFVRIRIPQLLSEQAINKRNIVKCFETIQAETTTQEYGDGCVVGALIKGPKESFFLQLGDTLLLGVKDGVIVAKAKEHNCTTERRRVEGYVLNGRLFGVLEPTRGFGDNDLRGTTVDCGFGCTWKDANGILTSKPSFTSIKSDVDFYAVASDGLLQGGKSFEELYNRCGGTLTKECFDAMIEDAKLTSTDDITLVIVKP